MTRASSRSSAIFAVLVACLVVVDASQALQAQPSVSSRSSWSPKPSRQNNLDTSVADRHKEPQQNNLNCTGYYGAAPNHILVKVRSSLAQELEAELPAQTNEIRRGQARGAKVRGFLSRHAIPKLAPLYPSIIQLRKEKGWSDAQLAEQIRQAFPQRTAQRLRQLGMPEISRTYVVEVTGASSSGMTALLDRLNKDPEVEYAEAEHLFTTCSTPNDPYFNDQDLWGLFATKAPSAWSTSQGEGIVVAVVDTGIDYHHLDIAANLWSNTKEIAGNGIDDDGNGYVDDVRGWNFIGPDIDHPIQDNDPMDGNGHGTHVAGTIAAVGNNGLGIIGVAPRAKVMALKALDDRGNGSDPGLAQAILYAAKNGANVIHASWAGEGASKTIEDAIDFATNLGVVVVVAAGNNHKDALGFAPANSPNTITVAASDVSNEFATFSNFGSKIDVTAPGVNILSLRASGSNLGPLVGDGYMRLDGTSMAASHVSGLVALLLSKNPSASVEDIRQILRTSATEGKSAGWDPQFGYGIANAQAALAVTDVMQAHLSSPRGGMPVNSAVTISGIAKGNQFDHYVLECGIGTTPTSWITLQTGSAPVAGGVLGTFNPGILPDGRCTIRLTVVGNDGRTYSDHMMFVVTGAEITSPVPPRVPTTPMEFKPGTKIPLEGTATGASFGSFRIEWAQGIKPSSGWSATGITLSGGGTSPVVSGLLGTWDTTGITKASHYTVRVVVDDSGITRQAESIVYLEPDLLSSQWPHTLDSTPRDTFGIVPLTDITGKTLLALVASVNASEKVAPKLLKFFPDGSLQSSVPLVQGTFGNPCVGELDSKPGQEIVFANSNESISAFRPDNTSLPFKLPSSLGGVVFDFSQIVLESLQNDSKLNAVAVGLDHSSKKAYLFAWLNDGSLLNSNFPIEVSNNPFDPEMPPRALVGDVNGDGVKEIVVAEGLGSTFTLALFRQDGTRIPWAVPVFNGSPRHNTLVLADLDHVGKLETLIVDSSNTLHVIQQDGKERAGWPQGVNTSETGIAVGDLDRNGTSEIVVVGHDTVSVFKADGTSFSSDWPREKTTNGSFRSHPVIADIDEDGYPEILVVQNQQGTVPDNLKSQGSVYPLSQDESIPSTFDSPLGSRADLYYSAPTLLALRRDNTISRSWNMMGIPGYQPEGAATITVGDFNRDGKTDIALTYPTMEVAPHVGAQPIVTHGVAKVLTTGTLYNAEVNDWPMIYHDSRNTSVWVLPASSNPIVVKISPITITIDTGATRQFIAHVTGSANKDVTWAVNPETFGKISSSGLFTALSAGKCTVSATSVADNTSFAEATVTVTSGGGSTTFNEVESNDSQSTANAVPDTATKIVGTIGHSTDKDHFVVSVGAGEKLTVTMNGLVLDYDLVLYDSSGGMLMGSLNPDINSELVTYANTGSTAVTIILKVLGCGNACSATNPYTLVLERGPVNPTSTVTITINPTAVSLPINTTRQFTATVSGSSNTAVTWAVIPATFGTITPTGLFTAVTTGNCTVTATSVADTTKSALANITVTSLFSLITDVSPTGAGIITRNPDATSYAPGTVVALTAAPAPGYTFSQWVDHSGNVIGTSNTIQVTMNGNQFVSAKFSETTHPSGLVVQDLTATSLSDVMAKLIGPGISVSNVKHNGANIALGVVSGGNGIIGFPDGIVLSTGAAKNIIGPNTQGGKTQVNSKPGDPDLNTLIPGFITLDASVLEFDFTPSQDNITFEYVFLSEEYNEFVNSNYNDVFGFFLNGKNIALLPGTDVPVSINNVNGGNPFGTNAHHPEYYINNSLENGGGSINTEMDGLTKVLTVNTTVIPYSINHIKLAIADAGDPALDSNIILKSGSFVANKLPIANAGPDKTVEATLPSGATVVLDGSGSYDPDGDVLTYIWEGPFGTATGVTPAVNLPVGKHVIKLTVNDGKASATDEVEITVNQMKDIIPPITKCTLVGRIGEGGWYVSDVTATLTALDEGGSGVDKTYYSFDGKTFEMYTAPVLINREGKTSIYYYSVDKAGNIEKTKETKISIDNKGPIIKVDCPEEMTYTMNQSITLSFEASDNVSGLASVEAKLNGAVVDNNQVIDLATYIGKNVFTIVTKDNAGNITTKSITFDVIEI